MDESIEERFAQRGIKPTAIRLLVYRTLDKAKNPQSLRDLEETLVTVDRSTIFRALTLLLQHHMVHGIEDGTGSMHYEVCHGHDDCTLEDQHTHFFCEVCHRTYCLHDIPVPQIELPEGFSLHAVTYMVKGVCPNCVAPSPHPSRGKGVE